MKQATSDLFDRFPDLSARIVANAWQGSIVGALLVALPVALWIAPGGVWLALHFFFSFFFLACVGLRFAALAIGFGPRRLAQTPAVPAADLPVYSVLVALYQEAEVVPELVAALQRIDWPKSKLEIKLVCEADDDATLGAIRALSLPRNMEVVEVPVFGPRTKPKALAYALPLTSGDFVALYDAEDHPHPKQLLHAWQKFRESPPEVACVQAPLEIANRGAGIVARMFAFEYAALFRGMLPWLSANRHAPAARRHVEPFPARRPGRGRRLGSLQRHRGRRPRHAARPLRLPYRDDRLPDLGIGPDTLAIWLPQRTRWFKGWMHPRRKSDKYMKINHNLLRRCSEVLVIATA